MSKIMLHREVDVPTIHSFGRLAEEALRLLKQGPYDSATFQCDGVTVPVRRNASMEEVQADYLSLRRGVLGAGVRGH